jgi:zinc protease
VISATPQSVKQVTVDDLKKFHDQYYLPNNAILGVAGDVNYDQIVPLIEKYFGGWKSHPVEAPSAGQLPPPPAEKVVLVDRPGSVQTNILAGDYAVRRSSPDYIPLVVTNRILGGGPAARLFLDLREEKGLTYGAYSYFRSGTYPGPWMASTEVRTAVTDQAMQALVDNFKKIQEQKVPEGELDDARRSIVASFALSLEYPTGLLDDWLTVKYYGLPQDYWDRYPAAVAKVDSAVVAETAKTYIDLHHLQFVCVGDGSQIRDVLKKYGPLEVYNADGKRLD